MYLCLSCELLNHLLLQIFLKNIRSELFINTYGYELKSWDDMIIMTHYDPILWRNIVLMLCNARS